MFAPGMKSLLKGILQTGAANPVCRTPLKVYLTDGCNTEFLYPNDSTVPIIRTLTFCHVFSFLFVNL
jgi:hypothetical protein